MEKLSLVVIKNEGGTKVTHKNPKPDDRSDNVEKLQDMVQNTIGNIEAAEETMVFAEGKERAAIKAKNERRKESIASMRSEIQDEASDRKNGYSRNE